MKKQKKDKNKKDRAYYLPIEDIWNRYGNKYEAITKIVEEVKRVLEIKSEGDSDISDIVVKVLKDLVKSETRDEKNSSGSNR
ncbi:MAG: hypothetical protein QMD71_00260 [bacterium]|nr:hypothetical protein [bacterium]